jgi:hypothetical protein
VLNQQATLHYQTPYRLLQQSSIPLDHRHLGYAIYLAQLSICVQITNYRSSKTQTTVKSLSTLRAENTATLKPTPRPHRATALQTRTLTTITGMCVHGSTPLALRCLYNTSPVSTLSTHSPNLKKKPPPSPPSHPYPSPGLTTPHRPRHWRLQRPTHCNRHSGLGRPVHGLQRGLPAVRRTRALQPAIHILPERVQSRHQQLAGAEYVV